MPYCLGKGIWGPAPGRERIGHRGLGGALAMGWRILALGTQAQWTVYGLSEGSDVWVVSTQWPGMNAFPGSPCALSFSRETVSLSEAG